MRKLAILALALAPTVASADPFDYAWSEKGLASDVGISTTLGGGIAGFTDKTMRDSTSSVGGLWNLRVTLGSHTPLALDLGYVGTAATVNALSTPQSGTLVGTTAEGALRYNILPHDAWNPYAFAGIGWQRYDVTGASMSLSDSGMNTSDNSIVFPMGAGLTFRDRSGLVIDLKGTFRANVNQGLVLTSAAFGTGTNDYAPMHTWEASAAIGYEF